MLLSTEPAPPVISEPFIPFPPSPPLLQIFQAFRVETPRNHDKLFVQTNSAFSRGLLFFLRPEDLRVAEQDINHAEVMIDIHDATFLGTMSSANVARIRNICRNCPVPEFEYKGPEGAGSVAAADDNKENNNPAENLPLCNMWFLDVVQLINNESILQPLAPIIHPGSFHIPHPYANCHDDRPYDYQPYRRRRFQRPGEVRIIGPSGMVERL